MSKFPCTKCGACCRSLGAVPINKELFPYTTINGVCEKLTANNTCSVYENRPLVCNIDAIDWSTDEAKKDFHKANANVCNKLIDSLGIDSSFKVVIL